MKFSYLIIIFLFIFLKPIQAQFGPVCQNCNIDVGDIIVTTVNNFTTFDAGVIITGSCNNENYIYETYTVDGVTWSPNSGALQLAQGCYTFCISAEYKLPSGNICAEDYECKNLYISNGCQQSCSSAVSGSIPSTLTYSAQSSSFDAAPVCKTASALDSWIQISNVTADRIYFSVDENINPNQRTGYIRVEFGSSYTNIPVTQEGKLLVNDGGTFPIEPFPGSISALLKMSEPISNLDVFDVNVYPIPAKDKINVNFDDQSYNSFKHITIIDVTGNKLISTSTFDIRLEVDISGLPEGLFLTYVKNSNGDINSKAFTKM